ncbi:MAG: ABC transporter permease [Chitinivibrionales bacterium]|nr:ABC transporter permease [Chitinivibrionales bacterium]
MNTTYLKELLLINLKLCFLEIASNRGRILITTLGIFLAVAALLLNMAFVRGMDDDLVTNMNDIGGLSLVKVTQKRITDREDKKNFHSATTMSYAEAQAIAREIPLIKQVLIYKEVGWRRTGANGKSTGGRLMAITAECMDVFQYEITRGRTFALDDFFPNSQVCIIGKEIGKRLFGDEQDYIGRTLSIRSFTFTIIAVLKTTSINSIRNYEVLIPYPVYETRMKQPHEKTTEITFVLGDSRNARQAQSELMQAYRIHHRGASDVDVETNFDKIKEMESSSFALKLVLRLIAAISLLVGGISIMNIMFATIGNRIREIGVRKALGAKPYDIFIQFLIEAILVSCVGGIPGMVVAGLIVFLPTGAFPYEPRLTIDDYLLGLGFTIVSGVVSGLFPALKAGRMQPVAALRY